MLGALALMAAAAWQQPPSCDALKTLTLPHVTITAVEYVTAGRASPGRGRGGDAQPPLESCLLSPAIPAPKLPALGAGTHALVALTAAELTDGPFCPDNTSGNRWDADLLRIRRIGVTLRVQAAVAALRGPAGPLFTRGGTSKGGFKWVPDQEIRFDISPRNLNLGR